MEYIDIINRIVEAEQRAQEISNAALEKREHLTEELEKDVHELREGHLERAKKRIERTETQMRAEADERIARLDEDLQRELAAVDKQFELHRGEWTDKLFHMIIDRDADA